MRKTALALATLFYIGNCAAQSIDMLVCSGDLSFIEGANTSISCAGDLWIGGDWTLSAEESIDLWAQSRLDISDTTFVAPRVTLSVGDLTLTSNAAGGLWIDTLHLSSTNFGSQTGVLASGDINISSPVPEPGQAFMMLTGLGLLGLRARRRRPNQA
ncbi:PEP-CTERM sorting domain-containing protein [Nitrogeniibacter aestuarii]|uniref:PEP-CTERM sorting domain-containing protein n=1 Tax=Nitrogeniibacter aestuarii TaxID=2815343 RepID=UPI001E2A3992|nr:PEP-CTERM sorting domain-containing protein [Nitrogeniibacter aestuarii]